MTIDADPTRGHDGGTAALAGIAEPMAGSVRSVLTVLLDNPRVSHYCQQLARQTRLDPSVVRPILFRLSRAGWLRECVHPAEPVSTRQVGQPRNYVLAHHSIHAARTALEQNVLPFPVEGTGRTRERAKPVSPPVRAARRVRLSPQLRAVLTVLIRDRPGWLYGAQIACRAGVKLGTTYAILSRLATQKWVRVRVGDVDTGKRYFRLSNEGVLAAQTASNPYRRADRMGQT